MLLLILFWLDKGKQLFGFHHPSFFKWTVHSGIPNLDWLCIQVLVHLLTWIQYPVAMRVSKMFTRSCLRSWILLNLQRKCSRYFHKLNPWETAHDHYCTPIKWLQRLLVFFLYFVLASSFLLQRLSTRRALFRFPVLHDCFMVGLQLELKWQ